MKHLEDLGDNAIAQVFGYYIKSRGVNDTTQQGLPLLLNEWKDEIFLFPYHVSGGGLEDLVSNH